jgi:hypothetical protein
MFASLAPELTPEPFPVIVLLFLRVFVEIVLGGQSSIHP